MKMTKRVLACVLSVVLLFGLLPQNVYATEGTDVSGTSDTVTRAEWLKKLEDTFGFSVEEDNYPDNYFSDISSDSKDYYTIMLAAEFGLLDIEAGEAAYPDKPATREFAAHTLNSCLGFQLAEENYTFEDRSETAYPQDDQIAVNRGWFQLADNKFEPETAVTAAEVSGMLKDAEDVLDTAQVDNNYDSTYQFAENVVVIPQGTQVSVDEKDVVTVTDSKVAVNKGDTFVVWPSELPSIYVAEEVIVTDNTMVISTGEADTASAVVSVDSSGTVDMDLSQFEEADGVDVTYVKSQSQADSLIAAYGIEVNNNSILATKDISLANGAKASIACTLSDLSLSQKIDTKNKTYYVSVNGNSTITGSVSMDAVTAALGKTSVTIGSVRVAGVGTVTVSVDLALKGKITATYTGSFETGMQYSEKDGFRLVKSFVKKNFTTTAEATASIGMKVSVGVDMLVLSGTIYATTGITATFNSTTYGDGKKPDNCVQISAWLYVSAGASAKVDLAVWSKSWNKSLDIYNSSNSPVRLSFHYEDGKQVSSCARGNAGKTYVTPIDSKYGISSYGDTSSSGTDSNGESSTIWEYSVSDGTTTITGYNGKASIVCVPAMIDGYKITKIGKNAFAGNENLKKIVLPDGICEIGWQAFSGCSNLESVILPKSSPIVRARAFDGCQNLIIESISETVIEQYTFAGCKSIKKFTFPETLDSIEYGAFLNCTEMEEIIFQQNSEDNEDSLYYNIGERAFYGCTALKTVKLAEGLQTIESGAFRGCEALESLVLPESVTSLGIQVIQDTKIQSIIIPKNMRFCSRDMDGGNGPLSHCKTLKHVVLEAGMKTVPDYLCADAKSITTVVIPSTVTSIGDGAFYNCTDLTDVYFDGTPEEWEKIAIGSNNTSLNGATLIYHTHSYDSGEITAPTCTEQGYTTYTCMVCDASYRTDYVDAIGHTLEADAAKEPTCTESGLTEGSHCVVCNRVIKPQNKIPATGHIYIGKVTKRATCEEDGIMTFICSVCKDVYTEAIPATGHSYGSDWTADEEQHYHRCVKCDEGKDFAAHTFTWVVDKEATLTEQGVKHEECTTCKYRRNENTVIDKLQQGQGENDDTKKDDSTSNDGTVSDNGAASKDNSQTSDDNALKDGTGQEKNETEAADQAKTEDTFRAGTLKYKITSAENGTVSVTGTKSGIRNSVVIPDKVSYQKKSYKVTMIGAKALKNRKNITRVTIGKNVTAIGKEAFSGDKKIKTIVIKSTGISSVGSKAFKGIYKKATIRVPAKKAAVYKKLLKKKGQASTVKIKG